MRKSKRLFAMLLTLIMVISMAMPAMAYDVTVKNPGDLAIERTLNMYQIFKGTVNATDAPDTDDGTNTDYLKGSQTLSDIEWGSAFSDSDITNMIAALKDTSETGKYRTFAAQYVAKYGVGADEEVTAEQRAFRALTSANQVAEILTSNNENKGLIKEFADAAVAHASTPYKELEPADGNTKYKASDVAGGYYLIKDIAKLDEDNNGVEENHTHTDYIVQVVGNTEITAKSGSVTLDKEITNTGTTDTEVGSYSVGDEVKYSLTGTLPAYFNEYEQFDYIFTDTMSKGLTFTQTMANDEENLQVFYQQGEDTPVAIPSTIDINGDSVIDDEKETMWTATVTTSGSGETAKTELTVTFDDLKAVATALGKTFNENTKIIVEYTAILNENAVLGGAGNENSAELTFSNDPNSTGTGTTPSDKVTVFTFELDVVKKDGSTDAKLAGAEFVLYRMNGESKEYAVLDDDEENDVDDDKIVGWTPYKNDEEINGAGLSDDDKAKAKKATILTTPADGKIIYKGLGAGTYYLEEIKAPEGYNKLTAPIEFTIAATEEEKADGTAAITRLSITVDETETVIEDAKEAAGIVSMDVINNAGSALPETGGIGTTLFYLIGGAMALFAIVLLITKKRMASEN